MDSELPTLFYFVFFFSSYCVLDVSMHLEATFLHFRAFSRRFLSKVTYSNSYIHSHTDGGGCLARCRPALQEQFEVQCLYHDTSTCRPGDSNQRPSENKTPAEATSRFCSGILLSGY